MTTMNEVNSDKTKVQDFFFGMFLLFQSVLLLNSMCKLIHNRCTCKLVIKLYGYICVCKRTMASLFLCCNSLFSVDQF